MKYRVSILSMICGALAMSPAYADDPVIYDIVKPRADWEFAGVQAQTNDAWAAGILAAEAKDADVEAERFLIQVAKAHEVQREERFMLAYEQRIAAGEFATASILNKGARANQPQVWEFEGVEEQINEAWIERLRDYERKAAAKEADKFVAVMASTHRELREEYARLAKAEKFLNEVALGHWERHQEGLRLAAIERAGQQVALADIPRGEAGEPYLESFFSGIETASIPAPGVPAHRVPADVMMEFAIAEQAGDDSWMASVLLAEAEQIEAEAEAARFVDDMRQAHLDLRGGRPPKALGIETASIPSDADREADAFVSMMTRLHAGLSAQRAADHAELAAAEFDFSEIQTASILPVDDEIWEYSDLEDMTNDAWVEGVLASEANAADLKAERFLIEVARAHEDRAEERRMMAADHFSEIETASIREPWEFDGMEASISSQIQDFISAVAKAHEELRMKRSRPLD